MQPRRSVSDFKEPPVDFEKKELEIRFDDKISESERVELLEELARDKERAQLFPKSEGESKSKPNQPDEDRSNEERVAIQEQQYKKDVEKAPKGAAIPPRGLFNPDKTSLGAEYDTCPGEGFQSVKREPKPKRQRRKTEQQKQWESENLLFQWSSEETD